MTRGDQTREKLPDYADLGPGADHSDNLATLGREPTVEGVGPDGGDVATGTAAGGAKTGPMTSGPSDPPNIAGREGEFEKRSDHEKPRSTRSRS